MIEHRTKQEARSHLMAFAMGWLAAWSNHGREALPPGLPADSRNWLAEYRKLLQGPWQPADPGTPLLSIFSRVRLKQETDPPQVYWPAGALSLEELAYPVARDEARPDPSLWEGFRAEWEQVRTWDADAQFEAFSHLLHKWAWAVPCSYGESGVSLYHEFRVLSALVHASDCAQTPAGSFLLVGGDIPGIQDFVYTITSKGAAKGLRGRSFFIQLLGDAVVRRLLDAWKLPQTNVIYAAAGNFMLLAPQGSEGKVAEISDQVNRLLLATYDGDIALCLSSVGIPAAAVGTGEFGAGHSLKLKRAIAHEKLRRFVAIANKAGGWELVFEPQGSGGERARFCAVCQAELTDEELRDPKLVLTDVGELEPGETAPRACSNCATFRELAEAIGRRHQALYLHRGEGRGARWQDLLHELSDGWWYRFADRAQGTQPGETKLVLNSSQFLKLGAQGFQSLANTTPRVTAKDVAWWDEAYPEQEGGIEADQIRSFELLARAAAADGTLERVGVLRMDVDDLGQVLTRGLLHNGQPHRTIAATSALSDALDRFFSGYLNVVCREVTKTPDMAGLAGHEDEDLLYVIYAGGDDLFVVGSWHLLPLLAQRVRDAFGQYVGGNLDLHISAGITLEQRKFPLYQAATRAEKALEGGAKKHKGVEEGVALEKNAVCFLGQTMGWDEFVAVREQTDRMVRLVRHGDVPRGLLQTLQMIYHRFLNDRDQAIGRGLSGEQIYYGPWRWRQGYHLKRLADGKPQWVQEEIDALQDWTLKRRWIQYLGLVARWAEYLTRGKEE